MSQSPSRSSPAALTFPLILTFWLPLFATWLMMAAEGPYLAAIIARLPDPKFNLAAYGVAFAFAIIVESPVIMMMSAATALVRDAPSFRALRNFAYGLSAIITMMMVLLVVTPLFGWIARDVIGLDEEVARLTRVSLLIMIPWPGAIGYRRFYQGLLIADNLTRRVAYGTVIRLMSMTATALFLYRNTELSGAWVGAGALTAGVCVEAVAGRVMARGSVRRLLATPGTEPRLSFRQILHFYYPLALTSTLSLAAHPLVTFFMGQARASLESLAVLPVVNSLSFLFRCVGLSYQEAAIALMGRNREGLGPLSRFAFGLAMGASGGLALVAFTPGSTLWFEKVSGLTPELASFAVLPTQILTLLPGLSVLLSLQRAILVQDRNTSPITWATIIEVAGIAGILMLGVYQGNLIGVTAAALAFVGGRIGANLYLVPPVLRPPSPAPAPDPGAGR